MLNKKIGEPCCDELRHQLLKLLNSKVEIVTKFGPVVGTLIKVKDGYAVLEESDSVFVYVLLPNIQFVTILE
ncbi:hypothetical protein JOD45_002617 [Scopulibacillus daqui]|uniref:DUF2642 domain-containing protein n=1 Tax=Scopulibacillus daqui TaxID=1469162 RepID=A0ABS2Q284_9BACL|nr:hypothetical protein [Scopulibacillus daqui]MBM7646389.1 hypothetical protein [Scopulibacillus daqui]